MVIAIEKGFTDLIYYKICGIFLSSHTIDDFLVICFTCKNLVTNIPMSLITCPECNTQVSDISSTCSNCGFPIQPSQRESSPIKAKSQKRFHLGFLSVLKLLQALGFIGIGFWGVMSLGSAQSGSGANVFFWILLISVGIGFYTSTEGLITIVDLLSRIEQNTRDKN